MAFKKIFSAKVFALAGLYSLLVLLSLCGAFLLRFDFGCALICKYFTAKTLLLVLAVKLFFLALFGQFKVLLKFFHNADIASLFWAFSSSAALVFIFSQISIRFGWVIPRGVILIDYFLSIISFAAARMFFRRLCERSQKYQMHGGVKNRVAIIGAGDVGSSVAENLLARKSMGIVPVVFLDDDPKKIGGAISGLSVLPLDSDFKTLAGEFKIDRAIVAISKISRARLNEITSKFSKIGIETSVVPSYHDLTMGYAKISDLRKVSIEEVLGREQVPMGSEEIDNFLKGKTVLVTGAGGSIGGELCRQIAMRKPACLVMLDQCEVQLFKIRENLSRENFGASLKPVIGNVADFGRISQVMSEFKPQLVFHAAAHKHVPIMEYQAGEALKNNVLGTWNTALAASANGAEKFVFISTDKAVNP
ncbi:MAG: polysaccharide biosynthesis protein, partial [Opitutales bacterium]|nr:polysaccharide biosynthesis protein [Opitutales bacterium]